MQIGRLAARALHLLGRSTPGACRSESRSAPTWPRARPRTSGSSTARGPLAARREFLVEPTGKRALATLADVLGPGLVCAHCVEVDADEIALLARLDVPVVHCPRSNAALGCGTAPLTSLREAGVRVGLGTDSPASTPSFDPWEEMRAAVYGRAHVERRPDALSAGRRPRARDARRGACARARARARQPHAGQVRRSDRGVARRESVRSHRRSDRRGRLRRRSGLRPRNDRGRPDPLSSRRDRVARGTQHRKRRPRENARLAPAPAKARAKRPSWEDQLFFGRLRPPRALDVRPARHRVRGELRDPRRRLGLDRHQPGARQLLQRHLGDRGVAVVAPEDRRSSTRRARPPGSTTPTSSNRTTRTTTPSPPSISTRSCGPRIRTRCSSSPASTSAAPTTGTRCTSRRRRSPSRSTRRC